MQSFQEENTEDIEQIMALEKKIEAQEEERKNRFKDIKGKVIRF